MLNIDRKPHPSTRRAEILGFIKGYLAACAIPPTMAEIGRELRIGRSLVHYHIGILVEQDELARKRYGPRSIYPKEKTV